MATSHTVHCAADLCDEYSVRVSFQDADREGLAHEHRAALVGEGWSDVEGRDYCPDHPVAEEV